MFQVINNIINKAFKEFFDFHKDVGSIIWTQCIHLNESNVPIFCVHEFEIEMEASEDKLSGWDLDNIDNLESLVEDLEKIESIPKNVFKEVFGDHARIVATREGFKITECQHD
jgi:hypothetical protein